MLSILNFMPLETELDAVFDNELETALIVRFLSLFHSPLQLMLTLAYRCSGEMCTKMLSAPRAT